MSLLDLVNTWSGLILTFVGTIAAVYALYFQRKTTYRGRLQTAEGLRELQEEFEPTGRNRARIAIQRFNDQTQSWFGDIWSWKQFERCLLIAFVYPLVLLLFAWAFGGVHEVAGIPILPAETGPGERAIIVMIAIAAAVTAGWCVRQSPRIEGWLKALVRLWINPNPRSNVGKVLLRGLDAIAGAFAVAVAVAFAVAVAGAFAVAVAIAVAVA
ncbi:MAG: hypothetical protein ACFB6S_02995, partial [Geminicoccaceae bacterium]